jgi:hypothetical protein
MQAISHTERTFAFIKAQREENIRLNAEILKDFSEEQQQQMRVEYVGQHLADIWHGFKQGANPGEHEILRQAAAGKAVRSDDKIFRALFGLNQPD